MKKATLMLVVVFFLIVGNAYASNIMKSEKPQIMSVGKEIEVKDQATKMFIYDTMQVWLHHSLLDYYHNKYHADSISWGELKQEGIRIWIRQLGPSETDRIYTHLIKISLQRDELIINEKKKIKTEDTFTYVVNADLLSLCRDSGKSEKELKLINSYHKVRP
ncbi:hypothetical protein IEC97_21740 [Neobacillus cucumis]|uniref:hypothetical protein n=1 Tax=Neobacillus cucumis TaxID=1740721 RepID=UPI0018E01C80|nr:hypothetical protein [Neobacillus cucumis]MBI0579987.1 hypothetical protein [Neobacillus cucumis]